MCTVLLDPIVDASRFTASLKGITARRINALLGRQGWPLWQGESFDHWIRNETEFRQTGRYIEENPVRAGLVERAEDYRWSGAWERRVGRAPRPDIS